uniref:Uncharacterized protein n=1 Tax=Panagrolaimus sp. ES5 TaxID=591445 RepID=A0AC34GFT2_9BILA
MKNIFNKSKNKKQQPNSTEPNIPTTQKELLIHALELPVFGNTLNENFTEFLDNFESITKTMNNEKKKHCNEKHKLDMDLNAYTTNIRKSINQQHPNSSGNNEKSRERLMINKFLEGLPYDLMAQLQPCIQNFQTLQQL